MGQQIFAENEADGMVYIAIMLDDNSGNPVPPTETLAGWADQHGLEHPVVSEASGFAMQLAPIGYPTYVVIDRDMSIITPDLYPLDASYISSVVAEAGTEE